MAFQLPDFHVAYAEIFMLIMICVAILTHLFLKQSNERFTYQVAQLAIVGAALLTAIGLRAPP